MFNAPEVITDIPDIKLIYDINEKQGAALDNAVEGLDKDMFVSTMDEDTCVRWEKILDIDVDNDSTLEDRRLAVQLKVMERLPYSYRVILQKLQAIAPEGVAMVLADDRKSIEVKLSLKARKQQEIVYEYLDRVVPLDMLIAVSVIFNSHNTLGRFTHTQLHGYTQKQLREEVFN